MRFMNTYDIARAQRAYGDHPVLGPACETLANLQEWTNLNSDGWSYWPKPARAAARLMALLEGDGTNAYRDSALQVSDEQYREYRAALRPIRAFRTKYGADFEIVLPVEGE